LKIAVPLKYVPDSEAVVKIGADRKSINPEGVTFVINPYDEFAIEEALKIKEAQGGEVTVFTVGDDEVVKGLRTAMAMGADNAVHIKCPKVEDPAVVAKTLSAVLKDRGYDIILLGMKAIDDDSCAVGAMLAEFLGLPCVTMINKLELSPGKAKAQRETEMGLEIVESSLPAVFTAQKGLNEPRYASLKGIMMAKKKTVEEIIPASLSAKVEVIEMKLPPVRPEGRIVGKGVDAVPELVRMLKEEAKVL
jgi:electron transfer flavoprotein beta subunit